MRAKFVSCAFMYRNLIAEYGKYEVRETDGGDNCALSMWI